MIFAQGDPDESSVYIKERRVKLVVTSSEGKEAIVVMLDRTNCLAKDV
jgi:hypothetical protein